MTQRNCRDFEALLTGHVDGALAAEQEQSLRLHLDTCAGCTQEVAHLKNMKQHLRAAVNSQPGAPPGLETRIRARVADGSGVRSWWGQPAFAGSVAALCVVALTAAGWLAILRPMNQQIASVLRIGRGDHVHCTLERKNPPVGTMNRPLPGHHAEIVPVAQQAVPGFDLLESHFCRFNGRVFTHVVFGKGEKRLSVILTSKREGESLPKSTILAKMRVSGIPVYEDTTGALQTAGMETGRSWAFVVSDLPGAENLQVMAKLAETIPVADRP